MRVAALAAVRRGCRSAGPSGAARALSRDQQLLHDHGLRQGRRGRAHDQDPARGRSASARAWTFISTGMTAQAATVEQFVQCFADVSGRDFSQFMRWYTQAGTPEIVVTPHYDARAKTYRLDVAQKIPPTPGQPTKEPMVIPLAIGLLGKDGGELPLVLDGRPLERGVLSSKSRARALPSAASRSGRYPLSIAGFPHRSSCRSRSSLTIFVSSRRTIPIRSIAGRQCRRWRCRSSPQMSQPYARALRSARMKG